MPSVPPPVNMGERPPASRRWFAAHNAEDFPEGRPARHSRVVAIKVAGRHHTEPCVHVAPPAPVPGDSLIALSAGKRAWGWCERVVCHRESDYR